VMAHENFSRDGAVHGTEGMRPRGELMQMASIPLMILGPVGLGRVMEFIRA